MDAVRRDTLSVQEVAERLGISAATVRRKIKAGELHAVKWPTAQGFEWRVYPPGQADAHAPISDVQASINDVQVPTKDFAGLLVRCQEQGLNYITVLDEFEAASRAAAGGGA